MNRAEIQALIDAAPDGRIGIAQASRPVVVVPYGHHVLDGPLTIPRRTAYAHIVRLAGPLDSQEEQAAADVITTDCAPGAGFDAKARVFVRAIVGKKWDKRTMTMIDDPDYKPDPASVESRLAALEAKAGLKPVDGASFDERLARLEAAR